MKRKGFFTIAVITVALLILFIVAILRDTDVAQYSILNNHITEDEEITVTLFLENENELECTVIGIFIVNKKEYIALRPKKGARLEEDEIYLYRYFEDGEGNPSLDNIEDNNDYEVAADAFDKLFYVK